VWHARARVCVCVCAYACACMCVYAYRVWWRSLKERDHVEDVGIDENIILKRTLKKWDERERTDLIYVA